MERVQKEQIIKDLKKKMVFITGPRQVGKTWLAKDIARSILKTPKIYFYDTGMVKGDQGAVFENMVALCLLKHVFARVDLEGIPASLNYIRTKDGAEVDFCLVRDNIPEHMILCWNY